MEYGIIDSCTTQKSSTIDELNLNQKISLIAKCRKASKLSRQEEKQYLEVVQSLIPWAKKILRKMGLDRSEDNVQEALLQFLEIIDSGVESAYWIFERRITEHFAEKNRKIKKPELKFMYEEQAEENSHQESQMRLANVSLSVNEKELMNNLFSMSRDEYCVKFKISHESYDKIVANIKKKLGF